MHRRIKDHSKMIFENKDFLEMTPELFLWNNSDDKVNSKSSECVSENPKIPLKNYMKRFKINYDINTQANTEQVSEPTVCPDQTFKQETISFKQNSFNNYIMPRGLSNEHLNIFSGSSLPTENLVCFKNDLNNSFIKEQLNPRLIRNDTNILQLSQNEEFIKNKLDLNNSLLDKEEHDEMARSKNMKDTLFRDNSKNKIKIESFSNSNATLIITNSKVTDNSQLNKNRSMNSGTISSGKQGECLKQNQGLIVNTLNQNKMSKSTNMTQTFSQTDKKMIFLKTNTQVPVMTTVHEEIDSKKNEDDKNSSSCIENLRIHSKITLNKPPLKMSFKKCKMDKLDHDNQEEQQMNVWASGITKKKSMNLITKPQTNINTYLAKNNIDLNKIKSEQAHLINKREYPKKLFQNIIEQNKKRTKYSFREIGIRTPENLNSNICTKFSAMEIPKNFSRDKLNNSSKYFKRVGSNLENSNYGFAENSSLNYKKHKLSLKGDAEFDFNRMSFNEEPKKDFNLSGLFMEHMQNHRKTSNILNTNRKESKLDNQSKINFNIFPSLNCSPETNQNRSILNKKNLINNQSDNDLDKFLLFTTRSCEQNEFYKYKSEKNLASYDMNNMNKPDLK